MTANDLVSKAVAQKLGDAAKRYAKATDVERLDAWRALSDAAHIFSRTADGRSAAKVKAHSLVKVPFGRHAGKALEDVEESDLRWALKVVQTNAADPTKARFKRNNEELAEAIEAELEERS